MPKITIKTKLIDCPFRGKYYRIPKIKHTHCDMPAFRTSAKFGGWANSDMFLLLIERELRAIHMTGEVLPVTFPDCVTIEKGRLLDTITIELK